MKTIEQLQEENAALVAQLEALRAAIKKTSDTGKMIYMVKAYDETPQQHLAEIRAEAGRAGFIAGVLKARKMYGCEIGYLKTDVDEAANQYADSIRQGEVG